MIAGITYYQICLYILLCSFLGWDQLLAGRSTARMF